MPTLPVMGKTICFHLSVLYFELMAYSSKVMPSWGGWYLMFMLHKTVAQTCRDQQQCFSGFMRWRRSRKQPPCLVRPLSSKARQALCLLSHQQLAQDTLVSAATSKAAFPLKCDSLGQDATSLGCCRNQLQEVATALQQQQQHVMS